MWYTYFCLCFYALNRSSNCWLKLQDLTIASTSNSTADVQFQMVNGGTLLIDNVVFDGSNYQTNTEGTPFWSFSNGGTVIVTDSYFTNNDAAYYISNGTSVTFTNCTFEGNTLTTTQSSLSAQHGLFYIDGAEVVFEDCSFTNNNQSGRRLISLWNAATVTISNTDFVVCSLWRCFCIWCCCGVLLKWLSCFTKSLLFEN